MSQRNFSFLCETLEVTQNEAIARVARVPGCHVNQCHFPGPKHGLCKAVHPEHFVDTPWKLRLPSDALKLGLTAGYSHDIIHDTCDDELLCGADWFRPETFRIKCPNHYIVCLLFTTYFTQHYVPGIIVVVSVVVVAAVVVVVAVAGVAVVLVVAAVAVIIVVVIVMSIVVIIVVIVSVMTVLIIYPIIVVIIFIYVSVITSIIIVIFVVFVICIVVVRIATLVNIVMIIVLDR